MKGIANRFSTDKNGTKSKKAINGKRAINGKKAIKFLDTVTRPACGTRSREMTEAGLAWMKHHGPWRSAYAAPRYLILVCAA